jgi:hypothetical protein
MLVRDCRLATDCGSYYDAEWYYPGIPAPIEFVGVIIIPGDIQIEEDKRLQTVMNRRGQRSLIYMSIEGFKLIELGE